MMRPFGYLCVFVAAFALFAPSAQARSSRNSSGRYGEKYRLIEGDSDDARERERKREEERRKREEEAAKKKAEAEAKKKADDAKRTAAAKPAAPAKPPAPAKPKPTTAARKPSKPGTGAKTDDAREAEAAKLREQADKEFEKGNEEGLLAGAQLLRQILTDYDGTDAAASAQQQMDLLLADEQLGPIILLAEAQEEFDAQHYRKARNKFQALVQRYPKSEQAAAARARLAEIERDDLLKKTVYTEEELEEARLWFLAGNIHLENGRKGEAAAAYRRVVEEYPGCRYAVLSEEKLPSAQGS
ncbi:MAG: tetratricopeptide repeat protein [Planctomycetes bacterium]|nr:tetratricopeptide repeat protein [Planctomycetota bacterium]